MIINHNINASYVSRQLSLIDNKLKTNIERLSTGSRINKAKDDPIGLFVSEKMQSQIRSTNVAIQNAQLGINFLQTSEYWLNQNNDILQRMRELALQSANGIYSQEDRKQLDTEIQELTNEIDRIAQVAEFNKIKLFGSSNTTNNIENNLTENNPETTAPIANDNMKNIQLHIGANMNDHIQIKLNSMSSSDLGLKESNATDSPLKIQLNNEEASNKALGIIDEAIKKISTQKSIIGAKQERIEFGIQGLESYVQNMNEAEANIKDSNIAEETINYITNKILKEASISMLVQSNLMQETALKLFKNI